MKPIDQKLKYQIDKMIKTATTGGSGNLIVEFYISMKKTAISKMIKKLSVSLKS
jgi:hypothetical protein